MFSQQQLAKMAAKKKISQETFDAAVMENVEEFDMEAEEAVASAIQEFEAQGVDLSNIIKTASGGDISCHPAALAVKALDSAVVSDEQAQVLHALGMLSATLRDAVPADKEALLTVLLRAECVWALVRCLTSWSDSEVVALPALRMLPSLLGASREHQAAFIKARGVAAVQGAIAKHAESREVLSAALAAAASSGLRNEDGKAALMEAELGTAALQLLGDSEERRISHCSSAPEVIQGACAVLCTLTSPDDDTQPSSRAFPNARALGKEGAAGVLVGALRRADQEGQSPEVVAALCTALKQVAANDEICQEVAAAGGLFLALVILQKGLSEPALARAACSLLRQLASSDGNKSLLLDAGALEVITQLLAAHPTNYALLEQGLGLLTNLMLRNPEGAVQAVEGGCTDVLLEVMAAVLEAPGARCSTNGARSSGSGEAQRGAQAAALRQGCMALRNIASRSPEVRPPLLEKGTEDLLRRIKAAYPGTQVLLGVASDALRDLGVENYND